MEPDAGVHLWVPQIHLQRVREGHWTSHQAVGVSFKCKYFPVWLLILSLVLFDIFMYKSSAIFAWHYLYLMQSLKVFCLCTLSLTHQPQRPEWGGQIFRQFCLQQEKKCIGTRDPSGLHIIWHSEICGERAH